MVGMKSIPVEVIGFTYRPCSPFPCDDDRSCGLVECFQKETLKYAFPALEKALKEKYGDKVSVTLTSLDEGVPERVVKIIQEFQLPLPVILVDGKVVPVGAVSVPKISEYIDSAL